MITNPLLFILLLVTLWETTVVGGPCKLDFKLVVIKTQGDGSPQVELYTNYHVKRLSDGTRIRYDDKSGIRDYRASQGSCEYGSQVGNPIYEFKNHSFDKCGGDFEVYSKGKEEDNGPWDILDDDQWDILEKFMCNGQEFRAKDCKEDSGAAVFVTCTNLYSIDLLFPEFNQTLQTSLKNRNFNNLYQDYQDLVRKLGEADMNYQGENSTCMQDNNWTKHDSCAANFFKPIIAIVASYGKPGIKSEGDIANWTLPQFTSNRGNDWSNNGHWIQWMVNLTKMVINDTSKELDSGIFTREMIYTMLYRATSDHNIFPLAKSPLSHYTEQWYQYAKVGTDAELRKIFDLEVDERVREFCKNEDTKSPLCAFVAAKNKYDRTLLYLPINNRAGVVSLSAFYAATGTYSSFNEQLEKFLQTAEIKDTVVNLGAKLGTHIQTLARFDQEIAKADVGYVSTAIEKNRVRFETNNKTMAALVASIKSDNNWCMFLNMLELVIKVATAMAVTVATGGATASAAFVAMAAGTQQVLSAFSDYQNSELAKIALEDSMSKTSVNGSLTSFSNIFNKLNNNKQKIEDMDTIKAAVLKPDASFSSTDKHVKRFLEAYNNYEPAVTKTDLAELNQNYTQMLQSFRSSEANAGFLCKLAYGKELKPKLADAELIWVSINSLLNDILDQQFRLIDALVKVVRSKLDETSAKNFAPGLDYYSYNFEILVRHQLNVRVAAQEFCNTFQLLNSNIQNPDCEKIGNAGIVFLDRSNRTAIQSGDKKLQEVLGDIGPKYTITKFPRIPVTTGNAYNLHAVNWDKLMDGEVIEFALPINNISFAEQYDWNADEKKDVLLHSLAVFIPNILKNDNSKRNIQFSISAVQDNVPINLLPNSTRYAIKSEGPLSTYCAYSINVEQCHDTMNNPFDMNGPKYCVEESGVFANNLMRSPPVSMYSTFQIQLIKGYEDTRQALKKLAPVGGTLQLPARVVVYSNTARGKVRSRLPPKPKPPVLISCGPGEYRKFLDSNKQECQPCPAGSTPVAGGSFCASEAAARKIAAAGMQI